MNVWAAVIAGLIIVAGVTAVIYAESFWRRK